MSRRNKRIVAIAWLCLIPAQVALAIFFMDWLWTHLSKWAEYLSWEMAKTAFAPAVMLAVFIVILLSGAWLEVAAAAYLEESAERRRP